MNNFLLYFNLYDDKFDNTCQKLQEIKENNTLNFYILEEQKEYEKYFPLLAQKNEIDCILVFGGDGTILRAVKYALLYRVPIMGINLGHLGFLSEISIEELEKSIKELKKGKYKILSRMMLKITIKGKDKKIINDLALNDAVISKGDKPKLINLKVYDDRRYVFSTRCDGIIAASPTGSTAYSLSAGGPIISPVMNAIVVVPITPHVLTVRPIVFPASSNISFVINEESETSLLQLDGQNRAQLYAGDRITITSAQQKVDFIKFSNRTFFKTLRTKMHMGKR
ncbi:MAG: NAD(+)/NADH kinase [Candidatus Stygibacter australis]|nr:NAD(+)/NADH kinase [Candidatus Stygibacter australis]MDP8321261.1 NAD(+)/NADH kinase [Candidatus Stygibacter australis]